MHFEETGRLYRKSSGNHEFSWWFDHEGSIFNDFGTVGNYGDRRFFSSDQSEVAIQKYEQYIRDGFAELDEARDLHLVLLEKPVRSFFANPLELFRRNKLWEQVDEILALTGLG